MSPRALRHRARHPPGRGFGVTTCPEAPIPSPGRRGLRNRHVPRGFRPAPCTGRLWRHHMSEAPRPPPGRAPILPHVLWLQTRLLVWEGSRAASAQWPSALGRARAFPRCLTSGSSWPRQACGVSSALNAYVIGHTQRMASIKCVQDINAAGRRRPAGHTQRASNNAR
jgi:hypothetical protein